MASRIVSPSLGLMEEAAFEAPEPMRFLCGQGLQPIFINNLQGPQCVLSLWKQPILTAVNKSSARVQKTAIHMQAITELITKILICSLK